LLFNARGEIGLEPLVDHLLAGGGEKIKLVVGHAQKAYHERVASPARPCG
jgi:hypothetical protein